MSRKQEGSAAPGLASLKPGSLWDGLERTRPVGKGPGSGPRFSLRSGLRSGPLFSLCVRVAPHRALCPTDLILKDKLAPVCSGPSRILKQSETF